MAIASRARPLLRRLQMLWHRPLPYGLVSVAYLNPLAPERVKSHRQFFCQGPSKVPRMAIVLCNLLLWLRWIGFGAWRTTYRCVRTLGDEVQREYGISAHRQYTRCIQLALWHCISPKAYYQFRFYLAGNAQPHWDYIYHSELPAYHLRHDNTASAQQRRLLADKKTFAEQLRTRGVSTAEGQLLQKGYRYSRLTLDPGSSYFLKPVQASQAFGGFQLDISAQGIPKAQGLWGKAIEADKAIDYINTLFDQHDYLVQPRYTNHERLSRLLDQGDETIVLRVITWRCNTDIICYCAYLEIPFLNDENHKGYLAAQIDSASGQALPESLDKHPFHKKDLINRYKQRLSDFTVPHWHQCLANNRLAHRQFPDIYAIAWDNVITDDGVVILEGNNSWNIELPQLFCGGVLANPPCNTGATTH